MTPLCQRKITCWAGLRPKNDESACLCENQEISVKVGYLCGGLLYQNSETPFANRPVLLVHKTDFKHTDMS